MLEDKKESISSVLVAHTYLPVTQTLVQAFLRKDFFFLSESKPVYRYRGFSFRQPH